MNSRPKRFSGDFIEDMDAIQHYIANPTID